MTSDSVREAYRGHTIVARLHEGRFKGRVYKDKQTVHECEGTSISGMQESLKSFIDDRLEQIAEQRETPPNGEEYVRAFHKILEGLSDGHCAMLKAHYYAEGQTITATQLAKAAGYANYSAANLQYGLVGFALNEELPIRLPIGADGKPIATYALADPGQQKGSQEHWTWKLKPGVAYAIEKLGLHA